MIARAAGLLAACVALCTSTARAREPIATVLADFETDSVAASLVEVQNATASDCIARRGAIPARGTQSLSIEIGATMPDASVVCHLLFRVTTPIEHPQRVALFCWLNEGDASLAFRLRDAAGRLYETPLQPITQRRRWQRISAEISEDRLLPVASTPAHTQPGQTQRLTLPIEVTALRVVTTQVGRQTVFLDDLEIEHLVNAPEIIRGEFLFDQETHFYEPGATVHATLLIENGSRERKLDLTTELFWMRADGAQIYRHQAGVNLPASGPEFRSRQPVTVSQRLDEAGLYRLQARIRSPRWKNPRIFETTLTVAPSNRLLARGRSVLFGVRSNLLRETAADQALEVRVARDIGVQLMAVDTPWRLLEPRPGQYDFQPLDSVVEALASRDIAPLVVISAPPDWLAGAPGSALARQAALLDALAGQYGAKVVHYQAFGPPGMDSADLQELQQRLTVSLPAGRLLAPAWPVPSPAERPFLPPAPVSRVRLAFQTHDDPATALEALNALTRDHSLRWDPNHWWFHASSGVPTAGQPSDAVGLLRLYVHAAAAGVASLVWFDLRDDTADVRRSGEMCGLVRRDFSPKAALLGYATAAGMLTGTSWSQTVRGAPPEFESALFISSSRNVAVLLPRPNRVRPGLLAPIAATPGELRVFDLARRPQVIMPIGGMAFVRTSADPLFITIDFAKLHSEPDLELRKPWLRVPALVFCGKDTRFAFEIDPPVVLRESFVQLVLPPEAPCRASLASRRLQGRPGETLRTEVTLSSEGPADFDRFEAILRISLEGQLLQVPLEVRPLVDLCPWVSGAGRSDSRFRIGQLASPEPGIDATDPAMPIFGAYEPESLQFWVPLPESVRPEAWFSFGLAVEAADIHREIVVGNMIGKPTIEAAFPPGSEWVRGWKAEIERGPGAGRVLVLRLPSQSLGVPRLASGTRLLAAARYTPSPGEDGKPAFAWGRGLDGNRSSEGYRWLRLVKEP